MFSSSSVSLLLLRLAAFSHFFGHCPGFHHVFLWKKNFVCNYFAIIMCTTTTSWSQVQNWLPPRRLRVQSQLTKCWIETENDNPSKGADGRWICHHVLACGCRIASKQQEMQLAVAICEITFFASMILFWFASRLKWQMARGRLRSVSDILFDFLSKSPKIHVHSH